ncbi:hypothetical protein F5887DRAFT_273105 [Amanita rubescens]|nr:hypothetical protein F5887DRAFT_273105 [Amanita rubescens]
MGSKSCGVDRELGNIFKHINNTARNALCIRRWILCIPKKGRKETLRYSSSHYGRFKRHFPLVTTRVIQCLGPAGQSANTDTLRYRTNANQIACLQPQYRRRNHGLRLLSVLVLYASIYSACLSVSASRSSCSHILSMHTTFVVEVSLLGQFPSEVPGLLLIQGDERQILLLLVHVHTVSRKGRKRGWQEIARPSREMRILLRRF